jgi:hypothetical protein
LGILGFRVFFFFFFEKKKEIKKKKEKKKKERGKSRGGWTTPCPKMGWPNHPIFGQGVASATPYGCMGVAEATPGLWGWSGHPERPPRGRGVASATCWGWSGHPQNPKPIAQSFFFFFGLSGWPDHPDFFPPPPFFYIFYFFNFFFLFLNPKKKKIKKNAKTTPFLAKLRRFGLAQNGVVLERRVVWTTYHQNGPK